MLHTAHDIPNDICIFFY